MQISSGESGRTGAAAPKSAGAAWPEALRRHGPAAAAYALPFLLVFYLAMKGGGYDPIVRGEVGIAVWWLVLVGAAVGALPAARISRAGWVMLGLLAAFAVWTTLGAGWSESAERSVAEAGRVAAYLAVFALALAAQRADTVRRIAIGVGAALATVSVLALLSRVHPSWFPANEAAAVLPEGRRLNYPLDYWNGVAALVAIGIPLVLWIAASARSVIGRALAAAALPAMSLAAFCTLSRGGAIEIGAALAVFIGLYPHRLQVLPTLLVSGLGSLVAIAAAAQRDALADGFTGPAADSQASEMLAVAVVVCVGVALLVAAVALAERHEILRMPSIGRTASLRSAAAIVAAGIVLAVALGVPGKVSNGWEDFKDAGSGPADTSERFDSASGNGRYQFWSSMVDAAEAEPLTGIGPGTFELWWAREGTRTGFVRDAHSLYFESLGELGIPGLILIGALVLAVLGCGVSRSLTGDPRRRGVAAAATAGCAAFAVAAALDWVWELPVLAICFFLLAAVVAGPARADGEGLRRTGRARLALAGMAVVGLVVVAIPLAGAAAIRESEKSVDAAQLGEALDAAGRAEAIQPYSATASLQRALVLERAGNLDGAVAAARDATSDEPTNWRTWFVRSRLEARTGNVDAAVAAYREARDLNPRSPLFQQQ
jgi:hypothetical protein